MMLQSFVEKMTKDLMELQENGVIDGGVKDTCLIRGVKMVLKKRLRKLSKVKKGDEGCKKLN